jgi:Domain of unknown function (DUF4158)
MAKKCGVFHTERAVHPSGVPTDVPSLGRFSAPQPSTQRISYSVSHRAIPGVVPIGVCPLFPSRGVRRPAGISLSLKEPTILHLLHYPPKLIAERVVFTPADQAQIASCRGLHNRLGFAYQIGFLRLTDRFPTQQPPEILDDLLAFVAHELGIDPTAMQDYAQRQATVSAHQEEIGFHLGFRPFDAIAREALGRFLLEEATRLEHMPALLARAEEFLRDRRILLPALSTLRRLAGE